MDRVVITGIPPFDGEFELDLSTRVFSTLEWRWIKKISGYLPLTIQDGLEGGDPDIFVVMAIVALYRSGKIAKEQVFAVADVLAEPPFDGSAIQIIVGEPEQEADEDRPPASSPTTNGAESSLDVGQSEDESSSSSGTSLGESNGESSAPTPLRIGNPGSETSAGFDPTISKR
jgi:hypothetical protein